MVQIADYRRILNHCLGYLDGVIYPKDWVAPPARLQQVTSNDVMSYFNFKVYGNPVWDPAEDPNPLYRSNTIKNWKKSISHFMPQRLAVWNEQTQSGNPTRSDAMNQLLKRVKRKEVRKQGRPSRATRSFKEHEYRETVARLQMEQSVKRRYGVPSLMSFQFSMAGRIDDCCMWEKGNLAANQRYPAVALKAKIAWSKNVTEEREAPWQNLFGAMDPVFCVLVHLALWLEMMFRLIPGSAMSPYVYHFSNDINVPGGGKKSNTYVQRTCRDIWGDINDEDTPLGTHSNRKFARSYARNRGPQKDDVDVRGRWKCKRVSDVYEDTELPYVDAWVCETLCVGGACAYIVRDNCVTDQWIMETVCPNILANYGAPIAAILGKALLWLIFSDKSAWVPPNIVTAVRNAYNLVPTRLDDGENPIEKRLIVVSEAGGSFNLTILDHDLANQVQQQQGGGGAGAAPQHIRTMLLALTQQMMNLQQQVNEQRAHGDGNYERMYQQLRNINSGVRRIARQPGIGGRAPVGVVQAPIVPQRAAPEASLSAAPASLYVLWAEWEVGIGGRKAARLFTARERGGANKHRYHRRKHVWRTVAGLIRRGHTAQSACEAIYTVYGQDSTVTFIINGLARDRRQGTLHQDLVV